MKQYKAFLIGNGTMGMRHRARFEASGVLFTKILDQDAMDVLSGESWDRPDFVVVASPAVSHYSYVKFFLERKIPVLVEKPLATTAQQAHELLQLSQENDTLLFVAQSECYNPLFLNFRKYLKKELQYANRKSGTPTNFRMEFRREHGFCNRCRDVDVSLDLLVHDVSLFLMLFDYDDVKICRYEKKKNGDAAELSLEITSGTCKGMVANFIADRNSSVDVRTISTANYSMSLARYAENGSVAHVPDSLDNEHKFFLKLLAGACRDWAWRALVNAFHAVVIVSADEQK